MTWHDNLTDFTDAVSIPTAAQLNEFLDNLEWLHAPPTDSYEAPQGSDFTTTATTWAAISSDFTRTITTSGGLVLVVFSAVIFQAEIDFRIDGVRWGSAPDTTGSGSARETFHHRLINLPVLLNLAAGAHTISVEWKATSGTATIYTSYRPRLDIREL